MHLVEEKWTEILDKLKTEYDISEVSFKTWLKPMEVFHVEDDMITILIDLGDSGEIGINYIKKKYYLPLKVSIGEITGQDYDIRFILPNEIGSIKTNSKTSANITEINAEKANLNPRYTFDTFVVGSNNKFAHAASVAVAESPGEAYNPLFLYGGVGLGKTHLMHSIAHFIMEKNPNAKVLYATSEEFTIELIDAIRNVNNTSIADFREKYRNIDVLLIDDIQFIIGKESTQEEFFHTFNTLHGAKKQIIISSDKPPKDIEILEDRLRSRFEWGLIADISSPDYETRMAILKKKEELDGFNIDNEVIEYIAKNIKSNIRELEGSLNKIVAYANLEKRKITIELAEQVLKDIISPNEKKEITAAYITTIVAEHFDVSAEDIRGTKRSAKIVLPRQIVMYLCREMTNLTLTQIGDFLGGKDHSTIMSGIKKIEQNHSLEETLNVLKKKINP